MKRSLGYFPGLERQKSQYIREIANFPATAQEQNWMIFKQILGSKNLVGVGLLPKN